jgi:predicted ATPase
MASDPNAGVCLIRRVVIRNYKSIAACDVELGPLTFLVGPNGSGKSNFLDALRFISDALLYSLDHALRDRGGIDEVRRQASTPPSHFGIRLEFELPSGARGHYAVSIGAPSQILTIQQEECSVTPPGGGLGEHHYYRVSDGIVEASSLSPPPAAADDRLYLVNVSGTPAFRPVYDALSRMGFYNLNPEVMRTLKPLGGRDLLARDGSNVVGVLEELQSASAAHTNRINEYLARVVPGVLSVGTVAVDRWTTLFFVQEQTGDYAHSFLGSNMSDGTLRALGVLVALFQLGRDGAAGPLLVGLEEPETALHPAAAAVLVDAMRDATGSRQVLVTSHSPDLLDNPSIDDGQILAVVAQEGGTRIGHLDQAGRSVLRDHLFTVGDLLRMNQLRPDPANRLDASDDAALFDTGAPA